MLGDITGMQLITVLVSILIGLSVHEMMHAFVAHWLGDDTAYHEGRLTLNPLAHIDIATTILLPMVMIIAGLPPILAARPVPFNPSAVKWGDYGAALVGICGPFTNLILAIISGTVFKLIGADLGSFYYNALIIFTEINVMFFVFNMIPIPPLDGSRLLYAFAPDPVRKIMEQIEALGFFSILLIFFLVFAFFSGPIIEVQQSILKAILL